MFCATIITTTFINIVNRYNYCSIITGKQLTVSCRYSFLINHHVKIVGSHPTLFIITVLIYKDLYADAASGTRVGTLQLVPGTHQCLIQMLVPGTRVCIPCTGYGYPG